MTIVISQYAVGYIAGFLTMLAFDVMLLAALIAQAHRRNRR